MIQGLKKAIKLIVAAKNLKSPGCAIALLDKELKKYDEAIYVVVGDDPRDEGGIIVFEQYLKDSSLKKTKERLVYLMAQYKNCRIAKLQFIDKEDYGD